MVKKIILACVLMMLLVGCNRGDFKASIVVTGQEAPHDGFFINQTWWLYAGDIVPDNGIIVWFRGAGPNVKYVEVTNENGE